MVTTIIYALLCVVIIVADCKFTIIPTLKREHKRILEERAKRTRFYRKDSTPSIHALLKEAVSQGKLSDHGPGAPLRFTGLFGSKNPKLRLVLIAGMHGIEHFPIELVLRYVVRVNEHWLIRNSVQVVCAPVVNYWGFINDKRTNENDVDLVRNSPYRSVRKDLKNYPLLRGWKHPLIKRYICPVMGKTWYYMGDEYQPELKALDEFLTPYLYDGVLNIDFDNHTGNNRSYTTFWRHELDFRTHDQFTEQLELVFKKHGIEHGSIDYRTDGGFFEHMHQKYQKIQLSQGVKPNELKTFNGFTIEFAVLDDASNKAYREQYFHGSVFEPHPDDREEKLKIREQEFADILNVYITADKN